MSEPTKLEAKAREAAEKFANWPVDPSDPRYGKLEEEEDAFYEGYLEGHASRDEEVTREAVPMEAIKEIMAFTVSFIPRINGEFSRSQYEAWIAEIDRWLRVGVKP